MPGSLMLLLLVNLYYQSQVQLKQVIIVRNYDDQHYNNSKLESNSRRTATKCGPGRMNSESDDSRSEIPRGEAAMFTAGERTIRLVENRVDSRELFVATREIMIAHGEDVYRLRLTAQNKLLLTK